MSNGSWETIGMPTLRHGRWTWRPNSRVTFDVADDADARCDDCATTRGTDPPRLGQRRFACTFALRLFGADHNGFRANQTERE